MNILSLLLFRVLELLCEVAHGGKESVGPKLRRAWWWERARSRISRRRIFAKSGKDQITSRPDRDRHIS